MSRHDGKFDRLTLFYDAECNLCLAAVERLRRIRTNADLTLVPLQSADSGQLPPHVTQEDLLTGLHLVDRDGRLYRGADAVARIMQTVPRLAWLTPLYRLPGLNKPVQILYRLIAKYRYRLFGRKAGECTNGSCRIEPNSINLCRINPETHDPKTSSGVLKRGDEP